MLSYRCSYRCPVGSRLTEVWQPMRHTAPSLPQPNESISIIQMWLLPTLWSDDARSHVHFILSHLPDPIPRGVAAQAACQGLMLHWCLMGLQSHHHIGLTSGARRSISCNQHVCLAPGGLWLQDEIKPSQDLKLWSCSQRLNQILYLHCIPPSVAQTCTSWHTSEPADSPQGPWMICNPLPHPLTHPPPPLRLLGLVCSVNPVTLRTRSEYYYHISTGCN